MSEATFQQATDTLYVFNCSACGVLMGVPTQWDQARRQDLRSIFCPNGHTMSYRESPKDVTIRQLTASRDYHRSDAARERQQAESAKRSAAAARGVVTRIKKRIAKGVCPCCKRYFADVHRHIQGQHPEFQADA